MAGSDIVAKTAHALHRILVQNQIGTKLVAEIIGIAIDPTISNNRYVLTLWDAQCVALALAGGKLQQLLDGGKVQKGFALRVEDYTIETRDTGIKLLHIDDAQVLTRDQFRTLPDQVESKQVLYRHPLLNDWKMPSSTSSTSSSTCNAKSLGAEPQPSRPLKRNREAVDDRSATVGKTESKTESKSKSIKVDVDVDSKDEKQTNFDILASIGQGRCRRTLVVKVISVSLKELKSKKDGSALKKLDVIVMDLLGNQMLAFSWGASAVKLQRILQVNKVYTLQKGTYELVPKNPDFNPLDHPYEIKLWYESRLTPLDAQSPLQKVFETVKTRVDLSDVVPLSQLSKLDDKSEVNVLALVMTRHEPEYNVGLKENMLRKLVLNDQDGVTCELTLWNNDANEPWVLDPTLEGSVIALKKAEVRLFKGGDSVSLRKGFRTQVVVNPDIPEAKELRALFDPSLSRKQEDEPVSSMTISQFQALREMEMSHTRRLRLCAVITNIIRDQPWLTTHCPHCKYHSAYEKDLSLPIALDLKEASICLQCQKEVPSPNLLLFPSVEVSDHTGTESLKLRHRTVMELVKDVDIKTFPTQSREEQLAILSRMECRMYEFLIEVQSHNKFLRLSVISAKKVNASVD